MPRSCCVPGCRSNYNLKDPMVSAFKFPKVGDSRREKWIKAIHRADFLPTDHSVVCIKHFDERFVVRNNVVKCSDGSEITIPRDRVTLHKDAYPSVFEGQPKYCTEKLSTLRKLSEERESKLRQREEHNFEQWCEANKIHSFAEFQNGLKNRNVSPFVVVNNENFVSFHKIEDKHFDCVPESVVIFKVSNLLNVKIFYKGICLPEVNVKCLLGDSILCDDWTKFDNLLSHLSHYKVEEKSPDEQIQLVIKWLQNIDAESMEYDIKSKFKFLISQLDLVFKKQIRYPSSVMLWASLVYYTFPGAYIYIRNSNVLTLPHPSHLRKMLQELGQNTTGINSSQVAYLKKKFQLLDGHEHLVCLLLDEIYVTPKLEYKGGLIEGRAINANECATTVQVFMISSMLSKYKEVVALFPIKNLNAPVLNQTTEVVLKVLGDVGFDVLCMIADNNNVNRKMYEHLGGGELKVKISNPVMPNRDLYLPFDSVHLLKCVRNCWINQKDSLQSFVIPRMDDESVQMRAKFSDLKYVYESEKLSCIKLAPTLSLKALCPTNIERQNVTLALNIFNDKNVSALRVMQNEGKGNFEGTIYFLELIIKWWKIVNVKNPLKGRNLNDLDCFPIQCIDDAKLLFLRKLNQFLKTWYDSQEGTLTEQTFLAFYHTTSCLLQLVPVLINKYNFKYILLGKMQTDNLEARFGQYRQMSGCNYNVSVMQILESERKLKLVSFLKMQSARFGEFQIKNMTDSKLSSEYDDDDDDDDKCPDELQPFEQAVEEAFFVPLGYESRMVLLYVAGYTAQKAIKHVCGGCIECKNLLVLEKDVTYLVEDESMLEYFNMVNRGSLKCPSQFVIDIAADTYKVFSVLIKREYEETFLHSQCQKFIVRELAYQKI